MAEKEPKKVMVDEAREGVKGKITLSEDVAATIAALTAKEVKGIHQIGRASLISMGKSRSRGVSAEVGKKQAAFDLEVILEYGYDIRKMADEIRTRIAREVKKMTGREVVEVNIHVFDIKLPEEHEPEERRVM